MKLFKCISLLILSTTLFFACSDSEEADNTTPTTLPSDQNSDDSSDDQDDETPTADVPDVYKKIYGATDIYLENDMVVIEMEGIPDHNSPYYQNTEWASERYEAYNNQDFAKNPNVIASVDRTVKIPLNPTEASNHQETQLGTMGIALNGVAFYNQYAGPNNQPLTNEIYSFDQYNGHPQNVGVYHYHLEPTFLTAQDTIGREGLLGFLLDGFPVYGPMENGSAVINDDLDDYHGHTHATEDYPDGTYHYHVTSEAPYINGNGYYGTPGTSTD
ncbi:YHYH protein [Flammeovirga yaeyamensis]|uniref:YHYH protein n=1 Tax=Flammeovirga yaeyamensis TaxID=367791 RepID=A0AAX1MZC1_9BACT|nr:YHYH protein [Flammeovirga yaeyamensis]MBB3695891.1 hypothetical protein [Flammeovirga yaeyamensis]NMF34580.1 YHYH protein [Flammeovirga yaeyamensis]QWG00589.1 YHYH protein [Flammeovirga yaeyamensis]